MMRHVLTEPVVVECSMESDQVVTIVHNNLESRTTINGFESPMSYRRNISYFATHDQIAAIKVTSSDNTRNGCMEFVM